MILRRGLRPGRTIGLTTVEPHPHHGSSKAAPKLPDIVGGVPREFSTHEV